MTEEYPPATGQHRVQLNPQAAHLDEQLRYWRSVLGQAREAGQWIPVDREAIQPGDQIKCWGRWETVVRVNKSTVSVETGYTWTDKTHYARSPDTNAPTWLARDEHRDHHTIFNLRKHGRTE